MNISHKKPYLVGRFILSSSFIYKLTSYTKTIFGKELIAYVTFGKTRNITYQVIRLE